MKKFINIGRRFINLINVDAVKVENKAPHP